MNTKPTVTGSEGADCEWLRLLRIMATTDHPIDYKAYAKAALHDALKPPTAGVTTGGDYTIHDLSGIKAIKIMPNQEAYFDEGGCLTIKQQPPTADMQAEVVDDLKRYTIIDEYHQVWLRVKSQSFKINYPCDDFEHANWMQKMLLIALRNIATPQPAATQSVMDHILYEFSEHVKAIPLGLENKGHGSSAYNWGLHYMRVLESIVCRTPPNKGDK